MTSDIPLAMSYRDGKLSIEQQLQIFVDDLLDHFQSRADEGRLDLKGIHEVLAGIQYVLDYRIKGGRQPSLDAELMDRLVKMLALLCTYRGSGSQPSGGLFSKKSTQSKRYMGELNGISDIAFAVLFQLSSEVQEAGRTLAAMSDLRAVLKLHARLFGESDQVAVIASQFLAQLTAKVPQCVHWRDCFDGPVDAHVESKLRDLGFFNPPSLAKAETASFKAPPGLYADRSVARLLDMFGTSLDRGLSSGAVQSARAWYGRNEIPRAPKKSILSMVWTQLADFMIGIMLVAAVCSFLVDFPDPSTMVILLLVVVCNVAIGAAQEWKAARLIESISASAMIQSPVRVLRDGGREVSVAPSDLVPGDIVLLSEGDAIPADLRLATCNRFGCIESVLTGEPVAVSKSPEPIPVKSHRRLDLTSCTGNAFMGTVAAKGNAVGIAVRTGTATELGRISAAMHRRDGSLDSSASPLRVQLSRLSRALVLISVVLCAVVGGAGIAWGNDWADMLRVAVALAVSVIPEGLLPVMTVAVGQAVARLASRENAIVRVPQALERIAAISVLCTDKTGTLTQGKMAVQRVHAVEDELLLRRCAVLCNNVRVVDQTTMECGRGDTTEVALMEWAAPAVLANASQERRLCELPFDSDRRMMTAVTDDGGAVVTAWVKGAPEVVLARCALQAGVMEAATEAQAEMSDSGLRVLALAMRRSPPSELVREASFALETDLTLLGLLGLADPPRPGTREAIEECRELGCSVAMITGDHAQTAVAIARQLGITRAKGEGDDAARREVVQGIELDALGPEGLARIPIPAVFARVSPSHKLQIVQALRRRQGASTVVAMTGDGVNDAPAISCADVGIAMAGPGAADICRQVAAMILPTDSFAAIPAAIREGRRSIANIGKFVAYLMACNSAEIWTIALPVVVANLPSPLSPINILWANVIADVPPSMALGSYEPAEPAEERAGARYSVAILNWQRTVLVLTQGLLMALITVGVYLWGLASAGLLRAAAFKFGPSTAIADDALAALRDVRSDTFFVLTSLQLLIVFSFKSLHRSVFTRRILDNRPLVGASLLSYGLLLLGHHTPGLSDLLELTPVPLLAWLKMLGGFAVLLAANEATKWLLRPRWSAQPQQRV